MIRYTHILDSYSLYCKGKYRSSTTKITGIASEACIRLRDERQQQKLFLLFFFFQSGKPTPTSFLGRSHR